MITHRRLPSILIFFVLLIAACTKPVLIGSDLLEDEKANLKFDDNFDLSFFTEKTDSVIVHSDNVSKQLLTYLCGNVEDPVFGRYTAEIFAQPILSSQAKVLKGSTLDSVVLQLRYDTLGNYGSLTNPVTLEVYRMTENPEFNTEYYSDDWFMTDPEILGSVTIVPRPFDSITVMHPKDTSRLAPAVRIPLSVLKLQDFLSQDSSVYTNLDSFLTFFNGLHIKMTGANNTMLGFNLLNSVSKMIFYYNNNNLPQIFDDFIFTTGSIKTVYMEHDYSSSIVEPALGPDPETDYWFVQGMSGVTTRLSIDGLDILGNAIINQAELEVYCTFLPEDIPALYPPIKYLVSQYTTDTSIVNSDDVVIALSRVTGDIDAEGYKTLYGGVLEKVSDGPPAVYRYNMKITSQLKDIFQGKKENNIYFNPFEKANVPNRSVMFGPGHPVYAPRLRIYYTAL